MDSRGMRDTLLGGKVEAEFTSPRAALEVDIPKARLDLQSSP